jgi:hypothetical protein
MTPEEKEKHYDENIAPKVLELAKECQALDIPFIACAWPKNPEMDTFSETAYVGKDCNAAHVRTTLAAVRAKGNADILIWWMMRHAEEHGHNSACLTILGVGQKKDKIIHT